MRNLFAALALIATLSLGLGGCASSSQSGVVRCVGGGAPTNVQPQATYVLVTCPDGSTQIVNVNQQQFGGSYHNGSEALADAVFLSYLFGPHYRSYPAYRSYIVSPAYVHYVHSPAYAAYRTRTTTITRSGGGVTSTTRTATFSSPSRTYSSSFRRR